MAIDDYYKYLRRQVSRCGCVDSLYVIWAYSQLLQVRNFAFPNNIEKPSTFVAGSRANFLVHEWEFETIATEVILHAARGTKTMRDWLTLASIVQKLRNLENELYGDDQGADVLIEMSRIMHRQISWQQFRPQTKLAYRYYRIFSDPAVDAICQKVVGLSIDALYFQGVLAFANFASVPALEINNDTTRDTNGFYAFAARPLAEIRELIRVAHRLDHSYAYQVGALRQFPLIKVENESRKLVLCPLPTLLFWRLTSGLYYDLIRGDADFGNALGGSFERYVGEVIARVVSSPALRYTGEARYGSRQRPKATPDWLLIEGEASAAFIECKTKRITVAAKTAMTDLTPLQEDLGKLADAVVQLYERVTDYAAGAFPNLPYLPARKVYPIVVTLEEWYLFGERVMALLREAVVTRMRGANVDLGWLDRAPYSVMSAAELEDALQVVNAVGVSTCFEGKMSDQGMRLWPFGNYLRHQFPTEWKARKLIFPDESNAMFGRLANMAAISEPSAPAALAPPATTEVAGVLG